MPEEKELVEITVVIEGGCLRAVFSSQENVSVLLVDLDNVNAGDVHPLADFLDDSGEEVQWEKTSTPHAVW